MSPEIYLHGCFNIVSSSQLNKNFKFEEMTKCFVGHLGTDTRPTYRLIDQWHESEQADKTIPPLTGGATN